MDNLAHSLAGWALSEAGLREQTGLATATLVLAANLPDVDVLGLLFNENLAWRRGWTHGPVAMLILPPLLVAGMIWFDQWQSRRGTRPADRPALHRGWLFILAYLGWLSHPFLDFLNTYGIRLLMPFSERWFYGDTLFIIDLWLWLALGLGIWRSRRRRRAGASGAGRPAFIGLVATSAYIGVMGAGSVAAEQMAETEATARGLGPVKMVVANPVPINPFKREIVFTNADAYGFGEVNWLSPHPITLAPARLPHHMDDPAIAEARKDKAIRDFLYWSRLPYAQVTRSATRTRATVADARYANGAANRAFVQSIDLAPMPLPQKAQRSADGP